MCRNVLFAARSFLSTQSESQPPALSTRSVAKPAWRAAWRLRKLPSDHTNIFRILTMFARLGGAQKPSSILPCGNAFAPEIAVSPICLATEALAQRSASHVLDATITALCILFGASVSIKMGQDGFVFQKRVPSFWTPVVFFSGPNVCQVPALSIQESRP